MPFINPARTPSNIEVMVMGCATELPMDSAPIPIRALTKETKKAIHEALSPDTLPIIGHTANIMAEKKQ